MVDVLFYVVMTLFVIVCVFLMLLILIQKGRGGGIASAFGGGGGNTAFGSKTGDVLTWATSIVFGIFLVLAVCLNLLADKKANASAAPIATPEAIVPNSTPLPAEELPPVPATNSATPAPPTTVPATQPQQGL